MTNRPPVPPVEGHYALLRNGMVIMKMLDTYDPHRGPRTDDDLWVGHPDYDWSERCWRPDGRDWSGDERYDIIATISPADMQAVAGGELERLRAALTQIDALDPEWQGIESCHPHAVKGLVLRMGEIARTALEGSTV